MLESPDQYSDQTCIEAIVYAVADRKEVDPTDLPPLADVINTDALDALVNRESEPSQPIDITFPYAGYQITVSSDETATITVVNHQDD